MIRFITVTLLPHATPKSHLWLLATVSNKDASLTVPLFKIPFLHHQKGAEADGWTDRQIRMKRKKLQSRQRDAKRDMMMAMREAVAFFGNAAADGSGNQNNSKRKIIYCDSIDYRTKQNKSKHQNGIVVYTKLL